jgi:hypothetical protein
MHGIQTSLVAEKHLFQLSLMSCKSLKAAGCLRPVPWAPHYLLLLLLPFW